MLDRETIRADLIAGVVAGVLILPQAIALATLAGMPPEYGFYTAIFPVIIASLYGSSWHTLSGPNTAMCIMIGSVLGFYAGLGTEDYITYAITLSFMVGAIQLVFGILRLGIIFSYFSHAAMVAIITGVGMIIIVQQVGNFMGQVMNIPEPIEDTFFQIFYILPHANWYAVLVGSVTVVSGLLVKRYLKGWPHLIICVIAGMLAAKGLELFLGPATVGIYKLGTMSLSPLPFSAPLVILTMAIANSVHILVVFYHELSSATSSGRQEAMRESLRINLQPIFFTSLTTIIGLLTLNFSEVPPYRDLGNFVAAGIGVAFILSITFLPALMSLLPARVRRIQAESTAMGRFGDFVVHHRYWLLWSMAGVVIVLVAFIPGNRINDVYVHYFDESVAFRQDTDLLDKHLGGLYRIDYSLDSGESGGVNEPAFLYKVEAFTEWLRRQPEVTHVDTVTDIFKRLNKNLHGNDPAWYRLPDARDLAAQYFLLYEMSLPYGLDLNSRINVDKSSTRVTVATLVLSTREVLALERRARAWLRDNAPALSTEGTGPTMMFAHIGARNIRAMLVATTLALILISLMLILALRSIRIGLISIIPNLIPAGMAFGLWGIFVGEIGLALSVVTTMTLGIVVDDTVHFLSKYLRARREQGVSPEDATRYAFSHVGIALIITSLVLVAGFLIISLSSFYPNSGMGLLTAMVLLLALLADFLFLPPLLMKIDRSRGSQRNDTFFPNRKIRACIIRGFLK
uniref:SSD domain-containing protein n=1 Tax=Candidatus Kentrum sp. TUN TaxID=2126343 RepID=A0A450ZLX3_9GAMM|nr:MAG: hypothetical protein BECKTUN1418F_GA0071002_10575 [Candidatus Kentron sp. TUN]VFK59965.1 MAG: hypothetical protein BECKTUN1418E_GA0071001_105513 [Candidatus Kentron sp. TUN]